MRADVEQILALSTHAAAYIGSGMKVPELSSYNLAFAKVHELQFVRAGSLHGGLVANCVAPWIRRLEAEGVVMVRPFLGSVGMVASSADPEFGILTDGDRGIELWRPVWKGRIRGYEDERPYRVIYTGERIARWSVPATLDLAIAKTRLGTALCRAVDTLDRIQDAENILLVERCLTLLERGIASFGSSAYLWPTGSTSKDGAVLAVAVKAAEFVSGLKGKVLTAEVANEIWQASMSCFEAAHPGMAVPKAA